MPVFPWTFKNDMETTILKMKYQLQCWCDGFWMLDGQPYETGPEWVERECDHGCEEGETCDLVHLYLQVTHLPTGKKVWIRYADLPYRGAPGDLFSEAQEMNAMEVLGWMAQ